VAPPCQLTIRVVIATTTARGEGKSPSRSDRSMLLLRADPVTDERLDALVPVAT